MMKQISSFFSPAISLRRLLKHLNSVQLSWKILYFRHSPIFLIILTVTLVHFFVTYVVWQYSVEKYGFQDATERHKLDRYSSRDLKILFVVPTMSEKRSMLNVNKLKSVFHSLHVANYSSYVDLEVVILPSKNPSKLHFTKTVVNSFQWEHGKFQVSISPTGGEMENIIALWNPPRNSVQSVAIIHAALVTNSVPSNWFQLIDAARKKYSHRADIFAFSPEPPEYLKQKSKLPRNDEGYFLWQGYHNNAIIVPSSARSWTSFLNWLQRERGNWYLWPSVLRTTGKGDKKWDSFDSTVRASWQLWLSRFCVLHEMFIFYPTESNISITPRKDDSDSRREYISKLHINGTAMPHRMKSRISKNTITKILEYSKQTGGIVSFTIVNEAYIETARSWICNVDVGGFRPPGIVWITTDDAAYNVMKQVEDSFAIRSNEFRGGNGSAYGLPGYWLLMLERAMLVRDILKEGCAVFLFETDQVWLRNPLPFVKRIVDSGDDVDLVGTFDVNREIGGNFLFLNPSIEMRKVYSEVCRRFEEEYNRKRIDDSPLAKKVRVPNDQSLLSLLVLYEEPFRSQNPIVIRLLDMELFACGKWYDGTASLYSTAKSRSPTLINNNFIRGIDKKTERLKKFGHWFWEGNSCNRSRVKNAIYENERRRADYWRKAHKKMESSSMLVGEDYFTDIDWLISSIEKGNV